MFLELEFREGPDGPGGMFCECCKKPIGRGHPVEEIRLAPDPEHGLERLNGTYHAECARPYLSVIRALNSLRCSF